LRHVLAAAALLCLSERAASAQTVQPSLDVRTWRPSTDPSASLVLEPTATPGPWSYNVGVWIDYTNRPIAIGQSGSTTLLHPIDNLLASDLTASLGLGTRAAVGLDLPMFLYQEGASHLPASAVTQGRVPTSGLGDLAVTGKGAIVTNDDGGFGLAVLAAVTAPTGDRQSFMGEGVATVNAHLLADYSLVFGSVQATFGYTLVTEHHTWLGVKFGDEVPWSLGVLLHPALIRGLDRGDRQTWEVALHGWFPAGPGDPGSQALSPALLAISERIALGHYRETYVLLGADIGLTNAIGVPTVRAIASVGWAPRGHDRDHDGVPDDVDQCPDIPEDLDGFEDTDGCPDLDDDEDGIPDKYDACPQVKGVADPDPKKNGCPRAPASERNPEPVPDPHADRITDGDGCPDEAGNALVTIDTTDPKLPIVLRSPIQLTGVGNDVTIDPSSMPTLCGLAQILNRHRDWTLAVGVRPGGAVTPENAVARAAVIARELCRLSHRDSAAEPVAWDSVARQPGGESGFAFVVLVGAEKPGEPVKLRTAP